MIVKAFFHKPTWTLTYLVYDEAQRIGLVIDSVRDYDAQSGRTSWEFSEEVARFVDANEIKISFALDTHAHADHLSGLPFFKERFGAKTAIGSRITEVQQRFCEVFDLGSDFPTDGSQFDLLLEDDQVLDLGPFQVEVLHTPGHTPACVSYRIGDMLFVGDTLFMPDSGTARCDFPAGSAELLYESIQRLYGFADSTRLFVGHDYQPGGRVLEFESSIAAEKAENIQLGGTTPKDVYAARRKARDARLRVPRLILPSIQMNIRAGELPPVEKNGIAYAKIPLNVL